eukprot:IDg8237t1
MSAVTGDTAVKISSCASKRVNGLNYCITVNANVRCNCRSDKRAVGTNTNAKMEAVVAACGTEETRTAVKSRTSAADGRNQANMDLSAAQIQNQCSRWRYARVLPPCTPKYSMNSAPVLIDQLV